jgi:hypothetical protein
MHSSTLNRRKLWTMSCETLFQNVSASLTPALIIKLCGKHQIPLPGANRGKVALFQLTHEHCHHDSSFAQQVQRHLNRKHTALIAQMALLQPEDLRATVESLFLGGQPIPPDTLPGILWAVCSDPREAVRSTEQSLIDELHLLSHCLLLAQVQGYIQIAGPEDKMADSKRDTLQQELEQLKAERYALQHDVRQLQSVNTRLAQDNAHLQHQIDACEQRCEVMVKQHQIPQVANAPQSVTPRELKKLRYELAKLTDTLHEKEEATQRLMALVSSYESMTADSASQEVGRRHTAQPEPEGPSFNLHGKTVALIGGLTKASMHYEEAISQLGGSCVRHSGNVNQGHKKLAKIIRQADVVLCPVDCVSHGAAHSAKKLCRTLDKPCYFLRSSGISHIREKLRQMALNS